jgi:hypothetical protein
MGERNGSAASICTCIRDVREPREVAVLDPQCPQHGAPQEAPATHNVA